MKFFLLLKTYSILLFECSINEEISLLKPIFPLNSLGSKEKQVCRQSFSYSGGGTSINTIDVHYANTYTEKRAKISHFYLSFFFHS